MDAMEEKCLKNMLEELISIKRHEAASHLPPLIKATGVCIMIIILSEGQFEQLKLFVFKFLSSLSSAAPILYRSNSVHFWA